nr:hypothetical protein 11 [bacterium]
MIASKSILTNGGASALEKAVKNNQKLPIKFFEVSSYNYDLEKSLEELEEWHSGDLAGYKIANKDQVLFYIDIPENKSVDTGKTFGVYLEDKTLLFVTKPDSTFPSKSRQQLEISLDYSNISEYLDFKYVPLVEGGKSIITEKGLHALLSATVNTAQLPIKYFKVSDNEYDLDKTMLDFDGWYENDISCYMPVDQNSIEFVIDIPPEKAKKFGKFFGLYLEDGTLFMCAKPPSPFPPLFRQIFRIQFVYKNANSILDFKYIPFSETEQDFSRLETLVQNGNRFHMNWSKLNLLEAKMHNSLDTRNNLSELDNVKARDNLNIYSRNEVDKKLAELDKNRIIEINNVDKVDGKDVDDNKNDNSVLWTAEKITNFTTEKIQANTIFCEYFESENSKLEAGLLVNINDNEKLDTAIGVESFVGVTINENDYKNSNLIFPFSREMPGKNFSLMAMTGYVYVLCDRNVKTGDYLISNKNGFGQKGVMSKGLEGFKRLLAIKSFNDEIPQEISASMFEACFKDKLVKDDVYLNHVKDQYKKQKNKYIFEPTKSLDKNKLRKAFEDYNYPKRVLCLLM